MKRIANERFENVQVQGCSNRSKLPSSAAKAKAKLRKRADGGERGEKGEKGEKGRKIEIKEVTICYDPSRAGSMWDKGTRNMKVE